MSKRDIVEVTQDQRPHRDFLEAIEDAPQWEEEETTWQMLCRVAGDLGWEEYLLFALLLGGGYTYFLVFLSF